MLSFRPIASFTTVLPFLPIAVLFIIYLMFFVVRRSTWLCRVDVDGHAGCVRPTTHHHYQAAESTSRPGFARPRCWTTRLFGLWLPDDMVIGICRFAFLVNDVSFWLRNNIHGASKSKLLILSEYVTKTAKIGGTWTITNSYMYT